MNISLSNFMKFSLRYNLVGCILGLGNEFGFNMLGFVKRLKANKKQIVPKIIEFCWIFLTQITCTPLQFQTY
jgi:hypothetical protein